MKHFLWIEGKKQGPYEEDEIRTLLAKGEIAQVTLVAPDDGSENWSHTYLPGLVGEKKPVALPTSSSYFIEQDNQTRGPYTIGQLRSMWNTGAITSKTTYCQEGDEHWHPMSAIQDLLESTGPTSRQEFVVVKSAKSRGTYIILGIFFGIFGVHDFYAGRYRRGTEILLCTLLLGWILIGLIISVIATIVELCNVTQDGDGQKMT
jgi:TM2 domain-containing membrane protein YozV